MCKTIANPAVKFAGVGLLNVFITLSIVFVLKEGLGLDDTSANFIGYVAGLLSSFVLNKRWTFANDSGTLGAFMRFITVFAVSYLLNIMTVLTALRAGTHDYLAHIMGMPVYSVVFYLGCRGFAFPASKTSQLQPHFHADHAHYRQNGHPGSTKAMELTAWAWCALAFVFSAIILFYRLGEQPIVLWDESRLANNALEMADTGLSLITTYNWVPDHWNTKPPALIWAMSISIKLLGPNEAAIRLPSVLSSLATGTLLFGVCAWHLRRPVAGFIAVLLLYSTPGYVLFHGARSGDYESMLILATTSYLVAGYLMLRARPPEKTAWLVVCSACIVLAFLTKTVQGLIMLPPLIAFMLLQKRPGAFPQRKALVLAAFVVIAICAGYYLLRERFDPGYFRAVQANDMAGRYTTAIERHGHEWGWYLDDTRPYPWLIPSFFAACWQLCRGIATSRPLVLLLWMASVFYFVVISSASTKLIWYAAPLSPLCALIIAIALTDFLQKHQAAHPAARTSGLPFKVLLFAGAAIVIQFNLKAINTQISVIEADPLDAYSGFLRSTQMDKLETGKLAVIHPGYPNQHDDPFYTAPTLFYVNRLRMEGRDIDLIQHPVRLGANIDEVLACGPVRAQVEKQVGTWSIRTKNNLCTIYSVRPRASQR